MPISCPPTTGDDPVGDSRGESPAPLIHQDHLVGEAEGIQGLSNGAPQGAQVFLLGDPRDHERKGEGLGWIRVHGSGFRSYSLGATITVWTLTKEIADRAVHRKGSAQLGEMLPHPTSVSSALFWFTVQGSRKSLTIP